MNKKWILIVAGVIIFIFILFRLPKKETVAIDSGSTDVSVPVKELYAHAVKLKNNRDMLKAKEMYKKIIKDYPDYENIESVQKELEDLNMEIIFSNASGPNVVFHEVKSGEYLGKLANQYGTTIDLIKKNNNLKNDIIRVGQKLRIWTGQFNVLVDKSQNILILKDEDEVLKVYDVSTGEGNSTPVGEYKIVTKLQDPVWFNRGVVVPPESPQNVLGSRWLGFDEPGYGIHGTIEPGTIGSQVTAGCVRMRNKDVEELYSILPRGTKVTIID